MFTYTTMVHLVDMERSEKMEIVSVNESNLTDSELDIINNKVRAILVKDDKVLIANYGGIILFPGGKVDKDESLEEALIRELFEETGIKYEINEFRNLLILKYYQHDYHDRGNNIVDRLITTYYYIGKFKGIDLSNTKRTEKEKKDNFCLELVEIKEILELLKRGKYNPRKEFFDREMEEVIKVYKRNVVVVLICNLKNFPLIFIK